MASLKIEQEFEEDEGEGGCPFEIVVPVWTGAWSFIDARERRVCSTGAHTSIHESMEERILVELLSQNR